MLGERVDAFSRPRRRFAAGSPSTGNPGNMVILVLGTRIKAPGQRKIGVLYSMVKVGGMVVFSFGGRVAVSQVASLRR